MDELQQLGLDEEAEQYLTFVLDGQDYGVSILSVQEILGWEAATPIPNAPAFMQGVINLRGTIVPVIDMRMRFNLPPVQYGPLTVLLVLTVKKGDRSRTIGVIVDAVSDVYNVNQEAVQDAPRINRAISAEFLRGLINIDGRMVMLLDTDKLAELDA
ncbi:chemotaxis protein CheW [Balneatrix alpica]|uniref:Chemotaxis protein CheW n=2 Tax=Balneatrix alpica TaxID=75684 RepID=A0ABV5ZE82_9GAMM|nr:chemotaxis protein CheW [Balneatrix alpica]